MFVIVIVTVLSASLFLFYYTQESWCLCLTLQAIGEKKKREGREGGPRGKAKSVDATVARLFEVEQNK